MTNHWIFDVITGAYIVLSLGFVIVVLRENRNPIRSMAWIMALVFMPWIGIVFYFFFGRSLRGTRMMSRRKRRNLLSRIAPRHVNIADLDLVPSERNLINLARNISSSFFTINNEIELLSSGREKFERLKMDLRNAKRSIFFQYYIFQDDLIGNEIAEILMSKAREGVKVRVIYDHVGSLRTSNRFFRKMQSAGVETHPFFRVTFPALASRINWRNHRKLVIIDEEIGYVGGMNIADRYAEDRNKDGAWRDTHFRLRGDIVESLLYSFIVDWNFKNRGYSQDYRGAVSTPLRNRVGMQFISSGPLDNWDNVALCFLKAITGATKSIYIQTPYFLPTDALQHALEAAALANIDVRIMIPGRSDSRMLQYATHSYVTQCLKSRIKVYTYNPGMLHAKTIIIDHNIVIAGSTNFDYRSFENNFECSLIVYNEEFNRKMRDLFFGDLQQCTKLIYSTWHKRSPLRRGVESIVRLISPIL